MVDFCEYNRVTPFNLVNMFYKILMRPTNTSLVPAKPESSSDSEAESSEVKSFVEMLINRRAELLTVCIWCSEYELFIDLFSPFLLRRH